MNRRSGGREDTIPDAAARGAIVERLNDTLFVEAGAGSGKTQSLVDRVVALVCSGVPVREIAVITFTEKAAAELRDRIRVALERRALGRDGAAADAEQREAARIGRDEIDGAAISTLHAFARRLLSECPFEAGLPPRVEVHDEISSQVSFDDRWSRFVDRLLDDDTLGRSILLLLTADVRFDRLRDLAVAANANWDLVAERGMAHPAPDPPAVDARALLVEIEAVCDQQRHALRPDGMTALLDDVAVYAESLRQARGDECEILRLLCADKPTFRAGNKGQAANWPGAGGLSGLRDDVAALGRERTRLREATIQAALVRVATEIARFTLEAADQRRRDATLEFHDLLVFARRMLRDPAHGPVARHRLRRRYTHLLLDEFQDTDPIQIELAVLIASPDESAGAEHWVDLDTDPGRLFFVGDPKQSIYRFRRADIATFLQARDRFGRSEGGDDGLLELTCNFRATEPIMRWVNETFGRLIAHEPGSQPAYLPLSTIRPAPPPDAGPPVLLLGRVAHGDRPRADPLREREAADVVTTIRRVLSETWQVVDAASGAVAPWRPARLGDICILLPARTSLPRLEDALDEAGIPYRAETSSLVYSTREIRDLLVVLHAVDDPTDELALVSALRTPVFGCGDDDLFDFKVRHGGRWNHQAPLPESLPADHPVAEALRCLCGLHRSRHWLAPSELIDRIVRHRRVLEAAFATGRPRDVWRRVRFVIDQARAFAESSGGGLRDFLHWAGLQSTEGARVVETVLPETDDDAVRILTVHGAKGLEFPIVILSGTTSAARGRNDTVRLSFPPAGGWEVRLTKTVTTAGYDAFAPLDEQMDLHERLRLLYVAVTRARDHLVVSLHRQQRDEAPPPHNASLAEIISGAAAEAPHLQPGPLPDRAAPTPEPARRPALVPFEAWHGELTRALQAGRVPRVRSATGIARAAVPESSGRTAGAVEEAPGALIEVETPDPGLAKEPRDLELPPWMKGRYGTAIGRAVHGVLQTVDLRSGADLEATVSAQAEAEGVSRFADRVESLVRAALASATVLEAVDRPFWRETYVATPIGDRLLEGYVDLIYRAADGLVVVDYKTDVVAGDADLDAKLALYRLQGASYALAVQRATGEPVVRCVFVFLTERGARERDVPELAGAMDEVERLVLADFPTGPAQAG